MMEAARAFETSVNFFQTTPLNNPEAVFKLLPRHRSLPHTFVIQKKKNRFCVSSPGLSAIHLVILCVSKKCVGLSQVRQGTQLTEGRTDSNDHRALQVDGR
ncbi:hypothetical protein L798_04244 [Zootermopsis nevadensis]|uniref:Uncharacterized protein n=1 Tax=Zootermopsis nevadensis TaxID=136037 RepID=A0A067RL28_ZOONE|nr:hypothetical protein L798_04244 [Zootermopsis nevadensis]